LGLGALDARDVDDAATCLDEHILEEVDQDKVSSEIEVHLVVVILREGCLEVTREDHTCAVYQHIKFWLVRFIRVG
jgi:hypothetical protein